MGGGGSAIVESGANFGGGSVRTPLFGRTYRVRLLDDGFTEERLNQNPPENSVRRRETKRAPEAHV
jgi:hypothetical protein